MAPLAKLGFLGWAVIAGAGTVVGVVVIGALYQPERAGDPAEDPAVARPDATPSVEPPASEPTAAETGRSEPSPADRATADDAALAIAPPLFDVVRVARDGAALVAGTAAPGVGVTLRVDGEQAAQAAADGAGEFVALFSLAPTEAVQMLTLEMVLADGRVIASPDSVVLTPRPAVTQPDPAPELASDPEPPAPHVTGAPVVEAAPEMPAPLAALPADEETAPGVGARPMAATPLGETAPGAEVTVDLPDPAAPETAPEAEIAAAPEAAPEAETAAAPEAAPEPVAPAPAPGIVARSLVPAAPEIPDTPPDTPAVATGPAPGVAAPAEPDLPTPPPAPDTRVAGIPAPPEAAGTAAGTGAGTGADDLPSAFLLRGTGEVTLLDRAPQVMDNVVIDMIGYGAAGDVRISGRAARADPEGRVQLYLDNQPIALAQAEAGDWRLDLPDIDPGVYTLRVDQLGAEGEVVSRFETPFQREAPELVARAQVAAAPLAPATDAAAEPAEAQPPRPQVALITVQPGHSLWRISTEYYGEGMEWVQIYRANRGQIRNPNLIYPGQVFTLPE